MLSENRDIMRFARQNLTGRWGMPVVACLIYAGIIGVTNALKGIGPIISLIIGGPLALGWALFYLDQVRKQQSEIARLFEGFSNFVNALVAYLLVALFTILWMLLLIVPGIMAGLSYSQTFFILADNPRMEALEAIRKSKAMMYGHRKKLFYLGCRFIGWFILGIITCGIGFLWIAPYIMVSMAKFYEELRAQQEGVRSSQP
jgi:uncharacterized membrane protein